MQRFRWGRPVTHDPVGRGTAGCDDGRSAHLRDPFGEALKVLSGGPVTENVERLVMATRKVFGLNSGAVLGDV